MNKMIYTIFAAVASAASPAFGADNTLKMMDANSDGMISKAEYMKHHERMWGILKKNNDGLVKLEDMKKAPGGAWKDDKSSVKDGSVKAAK